MEKGSVGDVSVYERNGQTIARKKHPQSYNFNRSVQRLGQLTRLVNVNNCWSAFGGALKGNFENKRPGQTDYNAFQSANLINARVYLTQKEVKKHVAVADNFFISKGMLEPVVEVEERGDMMVSNIRVGDLELNADTPVTFLAGTVMKLNKGYFRRNDEILFIRAVQKVSDNPLIGPYCEIGKNIVTLDLDDTQAMRHLLPFYFEGDNALDGFHNVDGFLGCRKVKNSLVAWVHRRRIDGKHLSVSTQQLVGSNNLLALYATEEARLKAIESYHPGEPDTFDIVFNPNPVINPFEVSEDAPEVTIQAESAEPEMGSVVGGGNYKVGTHVQLRAIPAPNHELLYWEDGEGSPVRDIVAVTDKAYKAHFIPK